MRTRLICGLALVGLSLCATRLPAEILYGTDDLNGLFTFDSANASAATRVAITGLQNGETLVGIDVRPATGVLYGIGSTNRVYTLNTATGAATQIGAAGAFTISGTRFGMDFNPIPDRIRLVSDADQSLRINPNDGTLSGTDTSLSPVSSSVVAAAYDRNFFRGGPPATDPTPTTLFGIDNVGGTLVRIGGVDGTPSPNGGVVTTVGSLGLGTGLNDEINFDISGSGVAFASLQNGGFGSTNIYSINLSTGGATLLGTVGNGGVGAPPTLTGLAAASVVPEPATVSLLAGVAFAGLVARRRR